MPGSDVCRGSGCSCRGVLFLLLNELLAESWIVATGGLLCQFPLVAIDFEPEDLAIYEVNEFAAEHDGAMLSQSIGKGAVVKLDQMCLPAKGFFMDAKRLARHCIMSSSTTSLLVMPEGGLVVKGRNNGIAAGTSGSSSGA